MKIVILNLCLLFSGQVSAQNYLDYFSKNSINIADSNSTNYSITNDVKSFNSFFIGEQHEVNDLAKNCILLSAFLLENKKIDFIFFETPYCFMKEYSDFNTAINIDTSSVDFKYYSAYDIDNEQIFKYIHSYKLKNINNSKINVIPIDETVVSDINDDFILNNFEVSNKLRPVEIRDDLVDFIKLFRFLEKKSNKDKRYLRFIYDVERHDELYKAYLKENYQVFKNTLTGLEISIKDKQVMGDYYYKSTIRENYMFKNIINYVDSTQSFISFNGQFHISTTIQKEYFEVNNWESIACKYNSYSKKKACSIYLLNLKKDFYFEENFQAERKIILDNMKDNGSYLIKLDGENTPFYNLIDKFHYILAW